MRKILWLIALLPILLSVSCEKDNINDATVAKVNEEIYSYMKDVYLWYDHVPNLDPTSYSSPYDLLDDLRYTVYDKWSALLTTDEYQSYFEEGTYVGLGFLPGVDAQNKMRIAMLYRDTEMYNKGVRRGWIINKIGGTSVTPDNYNDLVGPATAGLQKSFEFIDNNGAPVSLTLTKAEINITPVLHSEVINLPGKKIGYIVFQDFIETAIAELDEAFNSFVTAGIDEIIVDLRYNGGGRNDVAEHLGSLLIGRNYGGEPFEKMKFNDKYDLYDTTYNIPANPSGINVNRVFFIGTESTASASELVINGVKPYVPYILAGDTTHGKPVGMISIDLESDDYVLLPIIFRYTNADDEGDFYNGLPPQILANDDITADFGSPDEDALAAVLAYITGGIPLKAAPAVKSRIITGGRPINQFLKAY